MRAVLTGVPALVLAACIFTAAAAGNGAYLAVSRFPDGRELLRVDLTGASGFSLSFIHSVSNTRVVDIYRFEGDEIVQTAERFRAHGAGLPSHPDEPGGLAWEKEGEAFVLHMERPIPNLVVRTDKNYENRLMVGNKTVNLNQWEDQALRLHVTAGEAPASPLPR